MRQDVARIRSARGIDRHAAFVDVLNDSVLIDHERGPIAEALLFIENAVVLHHGAFEIAEQREK